VLPCACHVWAVIAAAPGPEATPALADDVDSLGLRTDQSDGRVVMGPVWDAAKAMGLCCGFPVEGRSLGLAIACNNAWWGPEQLMMGPACLIPLSQQGQ